MGFEMYIDTMYICIVNVSAISHQPDKLNSDVKKTP